MLSGNLPPIETPKLERYEIISEIGRGAMGVVYKALDTVLERTVAIKTINMVVEGEGIGHYEARFYHEARAAGGLNHPNIVTIYDIGKSGDIAYMAMEFIEGQELRIMLAGGRPLPVAQAVSIAAQVSEGLSFAHDRGIVHRDIKPANIMVVADKPVKITDFGIARMRASTELTQAGTMLGSPKYMSPEQALGKRADHRSDLFSLGVILYEMLVGTAPFKGENVNAIMYQIVNFAPPAPSVLNQTVPQILDYIVARMLAKSTEDRYQSASEAARDLRECERQLGLGVGPPRALDLPPGALSAGSEVILLDTIAKTLVLSQSADRTRRGDDEPEQGTELPQSPVSRTLDSAEGTRQLEKLTGLPVESAQETAVQLPGLRRPVPGRNPEGRGWRRRDWLLVGGATLLGLAVGGVIVKGRRR